MYTKNVTFCDTNTNAKFDMLVKSNSRDEILDKEYNVKSWFIDNSSAKSLL